MITLMLRLLRLLPFLVGGHCQLALENLALRQQLDVYKRTMARPPLRRTDRLFWVVLARVWTGGNGAAATLGRGRGQRFLDGPRLLAPAGDDGSDVAPRLPPATFER